MRCFFRRDVNSKRQISEHIKREEYQSYQTNSEEKQYLVPLSLCSGRKDDGSQTNISVTGKQLGRKGYRELLCYGVLVPLHAMLSSAVSMLDPQSEFTGYVVSDCKLTWYLVPGVSLMIKASRHE